MDEEKQAACYAMLGCSASASDEEIRSAFRRHALALHPDKTGSKDGHGGFQRLHEALSIIMQARSHKRSASELSESMGSRTQPGRHE